VDNCSHSFPSCLNAEVLLFIGLMRVKQMGKSSVSPNRSSRAWNRILKGVHTPDSEFLPVRLEPPDSIVAGPISTLPVVHNCCG
jgi:hypothetical protein